MWPRSLGLELPNPLVARASAEAFCSTGLLHRPARFEPHQRAGLGPFGVSLACPWLFTRPQNLSIGCVVTPKHAHAVWIDGVGGVQRPNRHRVRRPGHGQRIVGEVKEDRKTCCGFQTRSLGLAAIGGFGSSSSCTLVVRVVSRASLVMPNTPAGQPVPPAFVRATPTAIAVEMRSVIVLFCASWSTSPKWLGRAPPSFLAQSHPPTPRFKS